MLTDTLSEGLLSYRIGDKIKALRLGKKLGLKELSAHTGLSAGMLSKIERGQLFPTLPTLMRIALVFGVGLDHFFGAGEERPLQEIVRVADRVRLPNRKDGPVSYYFESLDYNVQGRSGEAFVAIFPRTAIESEPHAHDGIEMFHLIEGEMAINIHGGSEVLKAGDTMTFDARFEHSYRGHGRALVVIRPEI